MSFLSFVEGLADDFVTSQENSSAGLLSGSKAPSNVDTSFGTNAKKVFELDPNATPEELEDYYAAINYLLKNSETFRKLYQKMLTSGRMVYITFNDDRGESRFDTKGGKNTIIWDRDAAVHVGTKNKNQNAALGLAHEFGHFAQVIDGYFLYMKYRPRENDNLKKWETPIAKELGLPFRDSYLDGYMIRTKLGDPTSTVAQQ